MIAIINKVVIIVIVFVMIVIIIKVVINLSPQKKITTPLPSKNLNSLKNQHHAPQKNQPTFHKKKIVRTPIKNF